MKKKTNQPNHHIFKKSIFRMKAELQVNDYLIEEWKPKLKQNLFSFGKNCKHK